MKNKRLFAIIAAVVILLLVPLTAMQFTSEVKWDWVDFLTAGCLLLGTGLACEFVLAKVKKVQLRVAICVATLAALVIIWVESAVGLFGSPLAGS